MKTSSFFCSLIVISALFASCSNENEIVEPAAQPAAQANLPTSAEFTTVQNFVNAINAVNRTGAQALLSPDAGYAYSTSGALTTGQAFLNWLESDLFSVNARIEIQSATQTGNTINIIGRWGRNGNATNRANYFFTVQNGLITSWRLI